MTSRKSLLATDEGGRTKTPAIYQSNVEVAYRGVDAEATLPHLEHVVTFGLHGPLAAHYKVPEGSYRPAPATLDYLVAAIAGCMMATFGDALATRGVQFGELAARARGTVGDAAGTLVLDRVEIEYFLDAAPQAHHTIARVHAVHARVCPMHQSLGRCIPIDTRLSLRSGENRPLPSGHSSESRGANPGR